MSDSGDLKLRVARTLKWNVIDKVASQVLYAVTGIILANLLTKQDFGLVAAIMVFQAFATLFVDSGFSYALLQRKAPTSTDYSTVFWFNLGVAATIYLLLISVLHWWPIVFRATHGSYRCRGSCFCRSWSTPRP